MAYLVRTDRRCYRSCRCRDEGEQGPVPSVVLVATQVLPSLEVSTGHREPQAHPDRPARHRADYRPPSSDPSLRLERVQADEESTYPWHRGESCCHQSLPRRPAQPPVVHLPPCPARRHLPPQLHQPTPIADRTRGLVLRRDDDGPVPAEQRRAVRHPAHGQQVEPPPPPSLLAAFGRSVAVLDAANRRGRRHSRVRRSTAPADATEHHPDQT